MFGADCYGTNLNEANLYEANLERANFQNAKLFKADLNEANIEDANFDGADLGGTIYEDGFEVKAALEDQLIKLGHDEPSLRQHIASVLDKIALNEDVAKKPLMEHWQMIHDMEYDFNKAREEYHAYYDMTRDPDIKPIVVKLETIVTLLNDLGMKHFNELMEMEQAFLAKNKSMHDYRNQHGIEHKRRIW